MLSNNMRQTKIGFDQKEYEEMYKGKQTERVWLDFGKVNTPIINYNPIKRTQVDFNQHKMYFMLPPRVDLLPSNVVLFELVYLSSKDTCDDQVLGWGAFPIVNGDF